MTEAEWLASNDPEAMLLFLKNRVSDRKFVLYAVGYLGCAGSEARSDDTAVGSLQAPERRARKTLVRIELAARYADGTVCAADVLRAWGGSRGSLPYPMRPLPWAVNLVRGAMAGVLYTRLPPGPAVELLRDIFGNPFGPVDFSASWRTDTVVTLARQMYEARDFSAMPILADALQDAGCDNDAILDHCRDVDATHVRGCWVVDHVLGKQ